MLRNYTNYSVRRNIYKRLKKTLYACLSFEMLTMIVNDYCYASSKDKEDLIDLVAHLGAYTEDCNRKIHDYVNNIEGYIDFAVKVIKKRYTKQGIAYNWRELVTYTSILSKEEFLLFMKRMKEEKDFSVAESTNFEGRMGEYLTTGKIGIYLVDYTENFVSSKNFYLLEHFIPILNCLPYKKIQDLTIKLGNSACAPFLLNADIILEDKPTTVRILKRYLKTSADRKLKNHMLLLDSEIVSCLSNEEIIKLIERSVENGQPVRFSYTEDAVKIIVNNLAVSTIANADTQKIFLNFISLYQRKVEPPHANIN